ncbi:MAG: hypothetical protein VKL39_17175 [Leptolyngbyaceae bacterium]|nr:hypothetical protein [Leptolyngbyaceae bacterium]
MTPPDFSAWLEYDPYSFNSELKRERLSSALLELTEWHAESCNEYKRLINAFQISTAAITQMEQIPFLPVRLFKELDLVSVPREEIFKVMTSSGTSGQQVSKIYLDRRTAAFQTKVLSRLMSHEIGPKRLPMLVIDSKTALRGRWSFSARGAGILGFSMFGQDVTYALDEGMNLNVGEVKSFLERHNGAQIFVFGFTFMIWEYFVKPLLQKRIKLPLSSGVLLHGGGWKKLQNQSVSNDEFREAVSSVSGIERNINYYGMVEQTGSLFFECEYKYLHTPIYSDVIVRRSPNFAVAEVGEEGLMEVLALTPRSYPGHALLTEDLGIIHGEDSCKCGRLGKFFTISGRVAKAEARGCSDTHEISH